MEELVESERTVQCQWCLFITKAKINYCAFQKTTTVVYG